MFERLMHLAPVVRIGLVALAALGVVAAGAVLAAGAPRGAVTRNAPAEVAIPPMDRVVPARVETATLALG